MIETEQNQIINLIGKIDSKLDKLDLKIDEKIEYLDVKMESGFKEVRKDIEDLAIATAQNIKDISEIKDGMKDMVRKSDIEYMVTTEDIKDMVRKSDIEYMVTTEDIKDMATKEDIKPIVQLIGSYEIRARNIEDILKLDYKPRIRDLEKEVFAR